MSLTPDEQNKILESQRGWLTKLACYMTQDEGLRQDLAQEGWIEMWKSIKSYNPDKGASLVGWLHWKARNRMLQHFRKPRSPWEAIKEIPSDNQPEVFDYAGLSSEVEMAYHRGEINEAIALLAPREREFIQLRFWAGFNWTELEKHFGYSPNGLYRTAKRKLLASLPHLKEE